MWLESLEDRSLLATIDLIVNLYQDNGGVPGALIANDTVTAGQNFFVEITAKDTSPQPSGIIGLAVDVNFNGTVLDEVDSPFDPANAASPIITADFPLFRGGTLDNSAGTIDELRGASLPNLNQGEAIGVATHERFALLRFQAQSTATNSPLAITIGSGSVAFADGSALDGATIEAQTITITPDTAPVPTLTIDDITASEGSDGTTTSFTFTVTLSPASTGNVLVQIDTKDVTAIAPGDYETITGQVLSFNAGETTKTVTVKVVADKINEPIETFEVNLSKADGANIGDATGIGTILNDDALTASITKTVTLAEGDAGAADFDFTVTLDGTAATDVVIPWTFAHVTSSDADFDAGLTKSGKVTIPAGQLSAKITPAFPALGEDIVELDETFTVTLGTPETAGVALSADVVGTGTITNDDAATIAITGPAATAEGNAGGTPVEFTVTLSAPVDVPVSVNFQTQDGTASSTSDFSATTGKITFEAGKAGTIKIPVNLLGDTTVELDEQFSLLLDTLDAGSPARSVTLQTASATATITNDDTATVTLTPVSQQEGDAGTTNMVFTATLSNPVDVDVTVDFATSDGTATTANNDYAETKQTLTFTKGGPLTQTINVPIVGDTTIEPDETFNVTLSNVQAQGRTVTAGAAQTGTILDDDEDIPIASIGDVTLLEGDNGETSFVFTITLTKANPLTDVLLEVSTSDISAAAGVDYTGLTNQAVTIAKDATSATVTVKVNGDTLIEPDESFKLSITKIDGAKIGDGEATGTITNDDAAIASIDSVTLLEGDIGTTNFDFTVTLDEAAQFDVVIPYTFAHLDTNAADFGGGLTTTGKVTIPAGSKTAKITPSFPVSGDTKLEADEKFSVTLGTPENASITLDAAKTTGIGAITNDDEVIVSIDDVTDTEPSNGNTKNFDFTVSLDQAADIDVVVPWTFTNVTTADADFAAGLTKSGKVTILAGQTSAKISGAFPVAGDLLTEATETFNVTLGTPETAGAVLSDTDDVGVGTITDAPIDAVVASIDSQTHAEGNTGTTAFDFTVTLDKASPVDVVIPWTFANVTSTDADFAAGLTKSGKVTIPANQLSAKISFAVNGDTTLESDDTFTVTLGAPETANATVNANSKTGTGTITNDDQVTVTITEKVSQTEGNSGAKDFDFNVSIDKAAEIDVVVPYTFAHVTTNDADFSIGLTKTGKVTMPAGQTTVKITPTFAANGDTLLEGDETFTVTLGTPETTGAVLSATNKVGTGTIVNDDQITASINAVAKAEGNAGTTNFDFTVTLDQPAAVDVVIPWTFTHVTTNDADFGAGLTKSGKVTIPAGQTTANITPSFPVNGDLLVELDETFSVTLGTPETANVALSTTAKVGTGTVQNDDTATASIKAVTQAEGNTGTTNFDFTVTLDKAAAFDTTIPFTFAHVTTKDNDFAGSLSKSGNITIPAGQTSAKIPSFPVLGDTTVEADETFTVTLGTPDRASVVLSTTEKAATGTVTNDDAATITIGGATAIEPVTGTKDITFPVTLSQPADVDVTVTYTLTNVTTSDADFANLTKTGTLTFLAGQTTPTQPLTFKVASDAVDEPDETFTVTLTNPTFAGGVQRNVTIPTAGASATGTIQEDPGTAKLSGSVFVDSNKNGMRDANEIGVPGVIVTLTGTPNGGAAITLAAMTANDGTYSFTGLSGGTYEITETQPGTMADGADTVGTQGGTLTNDKISAITLDAGEEGVGNNFGELGLLAQFVSKRLFLASTPEPAQTLRVLNGRAAEIAGNQALADQIFDASVPSVVSPGANNGAAANNQAAAEFIPQSAGEFVEETTPAVTPTAATASSTPPAASNTQPAKMAAKATTKTNTTKTTKLAATKAAPKTTIAKSSKASTASARSSKAPALRSTPSRSSFYAAAHQPASSTLEMLALDEVLSREKKWR